MEEQPGLSSQYRLASPWPLFVALGFALSEVGVFMGVFPLAVGGILLLGSSVAGILRESGYVAGPWRALSGLGLGFVALGVVIVTAGAVVFGGTDLGSLAVIEEMANPSGAVGRGLAVVVAGVMLALAGVAGSVFGRNSP